MDDVAEVFIESQQDLFGLLSVSEDVVVAGGVQPGFPRPLDLIAELSEQNDSVRRNTVIGKDSSWQSPPCWVPPPIGLRI